MALNSNRASKGKKAKRICACVIFTMNVNVVKLNSFMVRVQVFIIINWDGGEGVQGNCREGL